MAGELKTAVLGAGGYAGFELARLLFRHPRLAPPLLLCRNGEHSQASPPGDTQREEAAQKLPGINGDGGYSLAPFSWSELKEKGVELLFLATPHEVSRDLVPEAVMRGLRVVDLSGAWRLKREQNRKVYKFVDRDAKTAARLTEISAYGLPELHSAEIAEARLVANPGCYATSIILALAPLLRARLVALEHGIVCDSKSGVSGAGKQASAHTHFVEVADNLSAYAVFEHRHIGEILEQLQLEDEQLVFTPHLLPIPRGIMSTIYLRLNVETTAAELEALFRSFYAESSWVRIFGARLPQIRYSLQSNYCDLGFKLAQNGRQLVLISCLDNLIKGAAGQAVQNMNVMWGWSQQEGLN